MNALDFSEILARLLTDGPLRDALARDPQPTALALSDDPSVRAQLLALNAEDLEFQAEILLRKRFEQMKKLFPGWICRLGKEAFAVFKTYARDRTYPAPRDAEHFVDYLREHYPEIVETKDVNRWRFVTASRSRFQFHGGRDRRRTPYLQCLIRWPQNRWQEVVLSLRF